MDLKQLRSHCTQQDIPIISTHTETLLKDFLYRHKPNKCLEIGSAVGYSSIFISSIIHERNGFLYSFEISHPSYIQASQNTKTIHNNTIYPFDLLETKLDKLVNHKFDFVFVDAQKSQYLDYMQKIEDKINTNGLIIFDDVVKYKTKVKSLYEYLQKNQIFYEILETEPGDGVMIVNNF